MDVSNASGYDGATVAADACYVAKHSTGRTKVVLAETLNPQVRQVVKTYAPGFGLEVVEVPHAGGTIDPTSPPNGGGGRRLRDLPAAERVRHSRARAGSRRGGKRRGRDGDRPRRPGLARRPRGARKLRLRDGDRRGAGRGQLPVLCRAALRLPGGEGRVHAPPTGPDHRRDDRPERRSRLRADAADP